MTLGKFALALAMFMGFASPTASAEVSRRYPDGFNSVHEAFVGASPDETWDAFGALPTWWDPAHTYTGDASNLSFALQPGACFCEQRGTEGVEHGRVVMAWPDGPSRTVRVQGALGPLQGLTTNAILMLEAVPQADGGSMVRMTYTVQGRDTAEFADPVDTVLAQQFNRLVEKLGGSTRPVPRRLD